MKTELVFFGSYKESLKGTVKGATAIILLILLDLIWFSFTKGIYKKSIENITKEPFKTRTYLGLIVYLFIASAIAVQLPKTAKEAFIYGLLLGLVIYMVFNLTNMIIFLKWPLKITIIDTLWGMILCGTTLLILYYIFENK